MPKLKLLGFQDTVDKGLHSSVLLLLLAALLFHSAFVSERLLFVV